MNKVKAQYTFQDIQAEAIYKTMPKAYYQHITKPHIIDKHRAWARNIHPAKIHISADPKVICTYRPIAEVVTSFIKLVEKIVDVIVWLLVISSMIWFAYGCYILIDLFFIRGN